MQLERIALRLVGPIYDAAENPEIWPDVLRAVGDAVCSIATCFTIEDLSRGTSNMGVFSRIDPAFQDLYNEYYQRINLHLRRARTPLTDGRIVSGHTLCTDAELLASEYYQDFLRPQDWFYPFGGCISDGQPFMAVLSFFHSRRQGPCTEEQTGLVEVLMPHLRRAIQLQRLGVARQALESIPVALILSDRSGKVHFANESARRILKRNDGLSVGSGDTLACDHQARAQLLKLAYEAMERSDGRGFKAGGAVRIARPSGKRRPYVIVVSPIRYSLLAPGANQPGVICLIYDPESETEDIETAGRRLYHFTPSEARLARILAEGNSLNQACDELHIQRTTARAHLRSLFDKAGVKRQAELVSVLLRSTAQTPLFDRPRS